MKPVHIQNFRQVFVIEMSDTKCINAR